MKNIFVKRLISFLIVFICGIHFGNAEQLSDKGVPPLKRFAPSEYNNFGKIWSIASAPNGIVYMAADRGLLEFDGKNWNHFFGSDGYTRSVLAANDSIIYTGSDLDFGVWRKNKFQGFEYTSLYPFQEDLQDVNEEFWQIHCLKEDIFFVSSQSVYIYRNRQLIKLPAPTTFLGSYMVNEKIYFSDKENGLFAFEDVSLKKISSFPEGIVPEISGIYQKENELVIVTRNAGLLVLAGDHLKPLNNDLSKQLESSKVFSFKQVSAHHLAFGTVLKGLYICDLEGHILHYINRHKGLPSNTILSLHHTASGKLWMGMDYGVALLDLGNPITTFYDYRGDFGTGYTAVLKDGLFYLGTNQGLYKSNWEDLNNNQDFFRLQLIPNTEGQVWTIEAIDEKLLMGHDKGLFLVQANSVTKLSDQEGVWTIVPYKNFILTGNYNGISIFRKSGDNLFFEKKMGLIYGSCNQIIHESDDIIWVNIPNFGIIRVLLDDDLNPLERLIFPAEKFIGRNAFVIQNDIGIHLITDLAQYRFHVDQMDFIQMEETLMYAEIEDQLAGVYLPIALHPDYLFIPIYNGFALKYLSQNESKTQKNHILTLRKMEALNNHEKFLIYPGAEVRFSLNNLSIESIIANQDKVLYQYRLKDSPFWSEWSRDNKIELISLRHGDHTLSIRALVDDHVTDELVVSFRIETPWYFSWFAYVLLSIVLIILIYLLYAWRNRSLKRQKKELLHKQQNSLRQQTEKHQQEIMLLEKKQLLSEYDRLKQQLRSKTLELANKARANEEKNQLLLTLKEKFEKVHENPALLEMKWGEMQRILDSYLKTKDNTFEIQIDELHQEFFRKLKSRFPDLSNNDLRMCAYLKIGLNSKEIAELLNIQPSSFYISRSRLRKRLKLSTEEHLYDFLNSFQEPFEEGGQPR